MPLLCQNPREALPAIGTLSLGLLSSCRCCEFGLSGGGRAAGPAFLFPGQCLPLAAEEVKGALHFIFLFF